MKKRYVKIVADSASDLLTLDSVPFSSVPLKITAAQQEYVDNEALNVEQMVEELLNYHGKTATACPNIHEWFTAFGDADDVFCVTITSALSGSYSAACQAKREYESLHPGRRVFVVDSLSTGPEERLIIEKLRELILEDLPFDRICTRIVSYQRHLNLLFILESMKNLANNGRVSPLVAKLSGLLGIRIVGMASDTGTLAPLDKCRGEKRALKALVGHMKELGHTGGKVRITHCCNESAAHKLKDLILQEFSAAKVEIHRCRGLCSYYAEYGGLLLSFETACL